MNAPHLALILLAACGWSEPDTGSPGLRIDSVLVTLIEQVEVPAQEAGVLANIAVREGQLVQQGDALGQIDDTDVRLLEDKARIELDIAIKTAGNDVSIRLGKKTLQLAKTEVRRALDSINRFKKSVTEAELDQRQLEAEKAELTLEQAEHEFGVAQLSERLRSNELAVATRNVGRRKIVAPIDGVIVQIKRRQGEWVEPGEPVMRLLRIDRLRVEGFVNSRDIICDLNGRPAVLTVDLPGKPGATFTGEVVFVSPEIDPVNGQVRIWAEVDNPDLQLRPGLQAKLTIDAPAPMPSNNVPPADAAAPVEPQSPADAATGAAEPTVDGSAPASSPEGDSVPDGVKNGGAATTGPAAESASEPVADEEALFAPEKTP